MFPSKRAVQIAITHSYPKPVFYHLKVCMPLPFIFPIVQQKSSKIFFTLQMKLTNHYTKNQSKFTSGEPQFCLCLLMFTSLNLKNKSLESLIEYKPFPLGL